MIKIAGIKSNDKINFKEFVDFFYKIDWWWTCTVDRDETHQNTEKPYEQIDSPYTFLKRLKTLLLNTFIYLIS